MSFLRAKIIDGHAYLYEVENKWIPGKGARQKVLRYLGNAGIEHVGVLRPEIMAEVFERDGYKCRYCGKGNDKQKNELVIDHILSILDGGTNYPDNLQILCKTCNAKKGRNVILSEV